MAYTLICSAKPPKELHVISGPNLKQITNRATGIVHLILHERCPPGWPFHLWQIGSNWFVVGVWPAKLQVTAMLVERGSDTLVYGFRMRVHIIQHVALEGPGAISEWARERGHSISITEQFRRGTLPAVGDFDFLGIMGGPMSANDGAQLDWLAGEKKLIAEALGEEKAILGVCLGAQLLAQTLGARVYASPQKEIGWFPVHLTLEAERSRLFAGLPARMTVLHWHGETFDLPQGAVLLAESKLCRNQAFELEGRVLGLQFHLEVQPQGLERLIEHSAAELTRAPAVQTAAEIRASSHLAQTLQPTLYTILDRLAAAAS